MTKKTESLIDRAKKHAQENASIKLKCWYDHFASASPEKASQIREFCADWKRGGESRRIFPRLSELHRFIASELEGFQVKYQAFSQWIDRIDEK